MKGDRDRGEAVWSWDRDRLIEALMGDNAVRGLSGRGLKDALEAFRAWAPEYRIRTPLILKGLGGVHRPSSTRTNALVHGEAVGDGAFVEQTLLFDSITDDVAISFPTQRGTIAIQVDTEAYGPRMPWPKGTGGEITRPTSNSVLSVSPFTDGDLVTAAAFFDTTKARIARPGAPSVRYTCASVTVHTALPKDAPAEVLIYKKARNWWETGFAHSDVPATSKLYLYAEHARTVESHTELTIHLAWREDEFWTSGPHQHQAEPTPNGEGVADWMAFVRDALGEADSGGKFRYAVATTKRYTQASFLALTAPPA